MQWFQDRSILGKLLAIFIALCVIMGLVGWVGVGTTRDTAAGLADVAGAVVPSTAALSSARVSLAQAQRDVAAATITGDPLSAASYLDNARQDMADAASGWQTYTAIPAPSEDRQLGGQYNVAIATAGSALDQARAAVAGGTPAGKVQAVQIANAQVGPQIDAASNLLAQLTNAQVAHANSATSAAIDAGDHSLRLLAALIAAGLVLALAAGLYVARSLASPLREMAAAAERIAEGELDHDIKLERRDEVGKTVTSFRRAVVYLRQMAAVADALATGDLTPEVTPHSERDVLGKAFQRMLANLSDVVSEVKASANGLAETSLQLGGAANQTGSALQQVAEAVQNVAAGAQDTSRHAQDTNQSVEHLSSAIHGITRGAESQALQVQAATATAEQMAAGVDQVASNASAVAKASQQAKGSAEQGVAAVAQTVSEMAAIQTVVDQAATTVQELGSLGQKIGAVVETIDDLAAQTNLLALNAAIEAARAGEHGRGFAVVADEVRKLAERSGRETKQIADLIAQVQTGTRAAVSAMQAGATKVAQGTATADQAGQALEAILRSVDDTVRQVTEIAQSTREMAMGARTVTEAIQEISAVVAESTSATAAMAEQAGQVTGAVQNIAAVAEEQSVATEQVSAATEQVTAQVQEMTAEADSLAATAQQLRQMVARFKLEPDAIAQQPRLRALRRAA